MHITQNLSATARQINDYIKIHRGFNQTNHFPKTLRKHL